MTWFSSPDDATARLGETGYLADAADGDHRRSSPARSASRCWSRGRPASARPSWPRRWPRRPAPSWCGCSATRAWTRRGRSTSGTTRSSCCASRPPAATTVGADPRRHLHRGVPAHPAAADRDPARGADTVLLIDEVDKTDVEVEGLLLEVLSDFQVTIPELGHRRRRTPPVRGAHLQRHPRAVRGAEAALPLPAPGLPGRRAGEGDRARRRSPASTRAWPGSWSRRSARCATSS